MMRTCDGTDPTLVRKETETFETGQGGTHYDERPGLYRYVPCACGTTFDDEVRSVIAPHDLIPGPSVVPPEYQAYLNTL